MADPPEKDLAKDGLLAIAPRDQTGRPTLGGIPLYKKLGQGGMGAVYLGKHPRLGVEVAVKILPFHLADQDPNAIEYFMREANVAARLNHPSLVRIFDVNVDGDPKAGSAIWYLVMEFVSGLTGGKLIRERMKAGKGPLMEPDALDLLLTVSDGLAAAHEENFVHRDIKPENIIIPLSPDGEPQFRKAKLMDLGLAKLLSEERSIGLTGTNVAMGTPGFMAPEQAENAKGAGAPSDVFAMGATLYTLLTGAAPFTGTTVLHVLKKTSDEPHQPLRKVNPAVSRPTEVLVDTCLAKRPEARYASAGVLREALKACRQSLADEDSTDRTIASLQNLVSVASNDPTVRTPSPSILPSAAPRTGVTAKTPEPVAAGPSLPAPARSSAGPLLAIGVVLLLLLAGGAAGAYFIFFRGGGGAVSPEDYEEAMRQGRAAESLFQWPEAEAAYGRALKSKETPVAKEALERVRLRKGEDAEFTKALRDADGAMAEERYGDAESLYEKAHKLKPASSLAEDGEARARRMKEQESSVASYVRDAEALATANDFDGAWQKIQAGIQRHPESFSLRYASGKLALDHGSLAWLGMALNDANQAVRIAGPMRRSGAVKVREALEAKKRKVEEAGGVPLKIQEAIDRCDWDAAGALLDKVDAKEREAFSRAIDLGRRWKSEMAQGKNAEDARQWPEALDHYRKALTLRTDHETEGAVRNAEREVRVLYNRECEAAQEGAKAGRFDDARRHLAEAELLMPSGLRHAQLKEEIQFWELIAESRRLKRDGKRAAALTAARKALTLRKEAREARDLVEELQREGPLSGAKAALAGGDRVTAARLAREAAADNPSAPELKDLERELWADLFAEKAKSPAVGPVDELTIASDGRVIGTGAGYGTFGSWAADDLKSLTAASTSGGPLFSPALIEKDGLRIAGLKGPTGSSGPEAQEVLVLSESGRRRLEIETSGLKIPVKATRLAPFDGAIVLRILWTAGGANGPDVYSIDLLDTDKSAAAMNPISNRAQAHASVAVAPSGKRFATGGGIYRTWRREGTKTVVDERKGDPQVYVWSRDDFEKRPVDLGEPAGEGALLAFTPDGSKLLVATAAKKLFVIDAAAGRVDRVIPLPEVPTSLAAAPAHVAVVAGGRVHLARLDETSFLLATAVAPARSVLFSRDGAALYVGGADGFLRRYAFEPLVK